MSADCLLAGLFMSELTQLSELSYNYVVLLPPMVDSRSRLVYIVELAWMMKFV